MLGELPFELEVRRAREFELLRDAPLVPEPEAFVREPELREADVLRVDPPVDFDPELERRALEPRELDVPRELDEPRELEEPRELDELRELVLREDERVPPVRRVRRVRVPPAR